MLNLENNDITQKPLLNLLGKPTGQTSTLERLLGSLTVDTNHIQTTLNWKPPFTVDEGLRETVRSGDGWWVMGGG